MSSQFEIKQNIVNKIVEALQKGGLPPWRQTWSGKKNVGLPKNLITKKPYHGINSILLNLNNAVHGFESCWYSTFKQYVSLKSNIRILKRPSNISPGFWGADIIYYNIIQKTIEDKFGEEIDLEIPYMREYTVFNVEQTIGLDQFRADKEILVEHDFVPFTPAQEFIDSLNIDVKFGGSSAYYSKTEDRIHLPRKEHFENEKEFYSTYFHELIHATHARCGISEKPYAFLELVAEIGSCFLMQHLNLPQSEDLINHYSYLDSWINSLARNTNFIFQAAAEASKAMEYLINLSKKNTNQGINSSIEQQILQLF